jgi:DNA polymerase-1
MAKVYNCTTCNLCKGIKIPATGPVNSDLMIIGGSPGYLELQNKLPLAGTASSFLNAALDKVGIVRELCYITNAVQCGDYKTLAKSTDAMCCRERLLAEIRAVKPKVIILLGKTAMKSVLGYTQALAEARGNVSQFEGSQVIVTYHPSAMLKQPRLRRDLQIDINKVNELLSGKVTIVNEPLTIKHTVLTTQEEVHRYCASTERYPDVGLDVETSSRGRLLSLALAVSNGEAVVLADEALHATDALSKWFSTKRCIGQGIKFDLQVLRRHRITGVTTGGDTMLQSYIYDGTVGGHGLKQLVREHLNYFNDYSADTRQYIKHMEDCPADKMYKYNAYDAALTFTLEHTLKDKLSADDQRVLDTLLYPGSDVLADMEYVGTTVDIPYLKQLDARMRPELEVLKKQLNRACGVDFNPNSPKQLQEIMYKRLGLPVPTKYSTDREALEMIIEFCPEREFPKLLLQYRALAKTHGTYVLGILNALDDAGRVHTHFNLHTTATGRLSSNEPNLQNITRGSELRNIFVATPGWQLVEADLSAAEVKGWCWFSRDEALKRSLLSSDAHKNTASLMYHILYEEVTKAQRQNAKTLTFGTLYGMTASTLAKKLGVTITEASNLQRQFFEGYAEGKAWIDRIIRQVQKDLIFKTYFGRTLRFFPGHQLPKQAVNFPIQNLASDITLSALIRFSKRIKNGDFGNTRLLLTVHDSILVETTENTNDVAREMVTEMSKDILDGYITFDADAKVGSAWGSMKEVG